jgi:hypothetical protein
MNFGMPRALDFAVERKRPNFELVPLAANDPLRYTYYLAYIMTMIVAKGLKKFFPPGWSLNPLPPLVMPPVGPLMGPYLVSVAALNASITRYDFYSPSQSRLRYDTLEAKLNAHSENLVNQAAGHPDDHSPQFTAADQGIMDTCLSVLAMETTADQKEMDVVGEFLIFIKNTVSLSLGQLIDTCSISDRPGVERRHNYILRSFLQKQETLCRGNLKTYNAVLHEIFNSIGKAETPLQCTFVLDQVDYFRNILNAYVELHPGAIPQLPTDEDFLNSIFYRLKNAGKLHDLHKLLKKVLDSDAIDYVATMEDLRLALQSNKPNIFDPTTLPTYSTSSEKIGSPSLFTNSQASASASSSSYDSFVETYLSLPHGQALAFHQHQANLGFGGTPVPSPQPVANPLYPGAPAWQSSPQKLSARCNFYPLCTWLNGPSGCKFQHLDVHGAKDPVLEQIQDEASASQRAFPTSSLSQWRPSPELLAKTLAALSRNPADPLAMTEMASKRARFSN